MRIAVLIAAVLALLAGAAPAQPRPEVAAALAICLSDGEAIAARAEALLAAGWAALTPTDRDEAAQAFAPVRVVMMSRAFTPTGPDLSPAQAQAELVRSRDVLAAQSALSSPRSLWFALPEGAGFLRLFDPIGTGWSRCDLVAEVSVEELTPALGAPVDHHAYRRMTVDVFTIAGPAASRLERIRFAPGTFAAYEAGTALVMPLRRAP